MSEILDQILIEDIAKYCPQSFINYHQCISSNHENPLNCAPQQQELAKCIRTDVPAFQKILTQCGQLLKDYEICLTTKPVDKQSECLPLLHQIRTCASGCVDINKNTANSLSTK